MDFRFEIKRAAKGEFTADADSRRPIPSFGGVSENPAAAARPARRRALVGLVQTSTGGILAVSLIGRHVADHSTSEELSQLGEL